MSAPAVAGGGSVRPAGDVPLAHRVGMAVFGPITRGVLAFFEGVGLRVRYTVDVWRALAEPRTYLPLTIQQMRNIGVDSISLTAIIAAFIGAVTAYQTRFQLFPGVPLSTVSWIVRQSIALEFGPLLTALVLSGRVGARMAAEIGTMRVTEQIDALETLAYDPLAYLVVPRVLAALAMLPLLTIVANAVGIGAGFVAAVAATDVTSADYTAGLRLSFAPFQIIYGVIKATLFGGAMAMSCTYEGYVTEAGAEGVGRSTARAVVITSVVILLLDTLTALYLAPYLQA